MQGRQETFPLDTEFAQARIRELNLKLYWIAEKVGVDRKTVERWLSGRLKSLRARNLQALAECLQCSPDELIADLDSELETSRFDQIEAAKSIHRDDLLSSLLSNNKLELSWRIMRSLLTPDLPPILLANLNNQLAGIALALNQLELAKKYANRALNLARGKSIEAETRAHAWLGFSNIIDARLGDAEADFEFVRKAPTPNAMDVSCAHLGLGWVRFHCAHFEAGLEHARKAIAAARGIKSTAYQHAFVCKASMLITLLCCELGHIVDAKTNAHTLIANSRRQLGFPGDANYGKALLAKVYAAESRTGRACELTYENLDEISSNDVFYPHYMLFASQVFRQANQIDEASKCLEQGLRACKSLPVEYHLLLTEKLCIALVLDKPETARQIQTKLAEFYVPRKMAQRIALVETLISTTTPENAPYQKRQPEPLD